MEDKIKKGDYPIVHIVTTGEFEDKVFECADGTFEAFYINEDNDVDAISCNSLEEAKEKLKRVYQSKTTMEDKEEKIQKIVLKAISEVKKTNNPAQYASMNYNVYEVAMKAVEIALNQE